MSNDDPSVKMISIKIPPFMQEQIQNIVAKALESPMFKTADMFEDNERATYQQTASFGESVAGRRIVVSVDGGRLRVRRNKRGPKTKKGRHRYHTNWREPKLLIIYVIDDEGNMDHTWTPIIDGLLKDHGRAPDAIFDLGVTSLPLPSFLVF